MTADLGVSLDTVFNNGCCHCKLRAGLKRLHKVTNRHGHFFQEISQFCLSCGFVAGSDGILDPADLSASVAIYRKIDNARDAVRIAEPTTCEDSKMPHAFDFSDLGLIRPISSSALFVDYPRARNELEPRLMAQLGIETSAHKRILPAQNFTDIHVNAARTVGHIFEPDPRTSRTDRIDDNHLQFWPLIPLTLSKPFEIWQQQPAGRNNQREWVFLACYHLEGEIRYHMVVVTRQRLVGTAYRLNGWKQAHGKRVGIPIYVGY